MQQYAQQHRDSTQGIQVMPAWGRGSGCHDRHYKKKFGSAFTVAWSEFRAVTVFRGSIQAMVSALLTGKSRHSHSRFQIDKNSRGHLFGNRGGQKRYQKKQTVTGDRKSNQRGKAHSKKRNAGLPVSFRSEDLIPLPGRWVTNGNWRRGKDYPTWPCRANLPVIITIYFLRIFSLGENGSPEHHRPFIPAFPGPEKQVANSGESHPSPVRQTPENV